MDSEKPRSFFLSSLPFFILAHATHHLLTALPQPMQPFIQDEFGLSKAQLGGVTAAFSLSSGASQLPAGWLADRIGPTWLITIGVLGVGIGGVLVGLSHSYAMLLMFLVLMGLMAGGYHPASTPLISLSVPANQRGRALGLHLIGGNSSFFLAPLIAGGIAAAWGWRGSFIALAIPTIILGFFFFLYLNKRYGKAHIEAMKRKQMEERPPQPGYKRRLIAFLTMMVVGGGAGATVNSFLPVYIKEVLGASNEGFRDVFVHHLFFRIVGGAGRRLDFRPYREHPSHYRHRHPRRPDNLRSQGSFARLGTLDRSMGDGRYPGSALPGNRSVHHEPINRQEPLDNIRDLLFDHAVYRRHFLAHHGRTRAQSWAPCRSKGCVWSRAGRRCRCIPSTP